MRLKKERMNLYLASSRIFGPDSEYPFDERDELSSYYYCCCNNNNNNNNNKPPETRKYWVDVQREIVSSHGERDPL